MCGIVGFIDEEKDKKKIIKNMADRIKHRGPDGEGYYTDKFIALGHRRLSILDIDAGAQPMYDETKNIVVVYNGEIYNYKDLKSELEEAGYKFKTTCDTEVLVHGYKEWGSKLPTKLRGMFAFAIYDKEQETLFCARDHFGIKPFYYYNANNTFMFGSEIKSFLEHPKFVRELNKELIGPYLRSGFTPTTKTFFKDVYRLNPGCTLTYKEGNVTIKEYYKKEFKPGDKTLEENVARIEKVMTDSVDKHLLSDVEVGSFLSSGIDSSYIVSLAKPDKTYTIRYAEEGFSEESYASDLANKLNIKNISKEINKKEYLEVVPKVMYHLDEPLSDPACIALYFLSELASKDLKVVLSGEGADEFFAGYNSYRVNTSFYTRLPFGLRHFIASIAKHLPNIKGMNFLIRNGSKIEEEYVGISPVFTEKECKKVLACDTLNTKEVLSEFSDKLTDKNELLKMQKIDLNCWLVKDILQKADRMTMAHSLESRVPFVDKEVFKVASTIPVDQKITNHTTKFALREAAKKVIPTEAYKKPKLGFPVPLRKWILESDYTEEIKKTINQDFVAEFFNQEYVLNMLDNCKDTRFGDYKKVWSIYVFIKWYEVFFLDREI